MWALKKPGRPSLARCHTAAATRAAAAVVGGLVVFSASALAAPSYQDAVNDYNSGKYAHALTTLQAVNAANPNNPWVHYYMALSHQAVGHIDQAKAEYQWVVTSRNPKLAPQAATGLAQLSGARTTGSAGSGGSTGSGSTTSTPATSQTSSGAGGNQSHQAKLQKVILFKSAGSKECSQFAPVFDTTRRKFSDVYFETYDVDEPSGQTMAQRYHSHSVPRVVFLDSSGNLLWTGGPQATAESFAAQIERFRNPN